MPQSRERGNCRRAPNGEFEQLRPSRRQEDDRVSVTFPSAAFSIIVGERMNRYTAVWDDDMRLALNGDIPVVLTNERFACDWKSTDGSVVCFSTISTDGVYYRGTVLEPTQRAIGTFTHPVQHWECRVEFRRHPATKTEPWVRMEYIRWASETEVMGEEELCDILLLPIPEPKRTKAKKPAPKRTRKP